MKCRNKKYIVEEARPEDSDEILSILEGTHFNGSMSFIYTRRPDPIASILREGEDVLIAVSRDPDNNVIAGMGVVAVRKAYFKGEVVKVGYLFGLRKKKGHLGIASWIPAGYGLMEEFVKRLGVKYVYTAILEENAHARRLLEKKRTVVPDYIFIGSYEVHNISTDYASRFRPGDFVARRCSGEDMDEVLELISTFAKNRDFYPYADRQSLSEIYCGLTPDRFVGVWDKTGRIAACGALWDQEDFKQVYAKKYGIKLKVLAKMPYIAKMLGYPALPAEGNMLRFGMLSFWAARGHSFEPFYALLGETARCWKELSFIVAGMYENEPFLTAMQNIRSIRYKSRIYLVDWDKDGSLSDYPGMDSIPYFDAGLL